MILEHKANGQEFLIVEVPHAYDCWIENNNIKWIVTHFIWFGNPPKLIHEEYENGELTLPPGTYTILFTAEEATEEQAEHVVESKYPISELQKVIGTYFTDQSKKHLILKKHS